MGHINILCQLLFLVLRPLSLIGGFLTEEEIDSLPDNRDANPLVTDDDSPPDLASTGAHMLNRKSIGVRLHGTHQKLGMDTNC